MNQTDMSKQSSNTWIAVGIGLVCSLVVWILQPLNNYLFNNTYVADNYMPELPLALMALIILAANPLLRRFVPRMALAATRHQLEELEADPLDPQRSVNHGRQTVRRTEPNQLDWE